MNIKPCQAENAIQVAAFLFIFKREFTAGELAAVKARHSGTEDDELPVVNDHSSLTIQFGPNGAALPHSQTANPLTGVTFSKITPSAKVVWSFTIQDNLCIVRCEKYSRWNEVYSQAISYVDRFFAGISEANHLSVIGLEYLDRFDVVDPKVNWSQDLFKENSPYLPQYIHDLDDIWHAHTGFFKAAQDNDNRILNKLNIDCLIENGKNVVNMLSQHHYHLNSSKGICFISDHEFIDSVFNELHDINKSILSDLLSDEVCQKIQLRSKVE